VAVLWHRTSIFHCTDQIVISAPTTTKKIVAADPQEQLAANTSTRFSEHIATPVPFMEPLLFRLHRHGATQDEVRAEEVVPSNRPDA
jgi:imidazoleglycerol phosphate dehydratase HisB